MDIVTSNSSDRATVHICNRRSQEAIRWYALTFPTAVEGHGSVYSPKGSDAELSRRKCCRGSLFEYFAPSYVETHKVGGGMVGTREPLLYDYVFIHALENEILRLKRIMPLYNLLPWVSVGEYSYFSHLSDHGMETLRWMTESYSNEFLVCVPDSGRLLRGDRVRITPDSFMGTEAGVVVQPGGGHRDVTVRILDCMWAPLFEVRQGEYEPTELSTEGKHVYTHSGNDRLSEGIHKALGRYYLSGRLGKENELLVHRVLRGCTSLRVETDVMRCKVYSLLLPTYKLLDQEEEFEHLYSALRNMFPLAKAVNSRTLLLVTLYGCTNSNLYYRVAHELIDP